MKKFEKSYPGILILVVGNSGSGKDSIIKGVVEKFPKSKMTIHLAQRYITRPPSEFEGNISISPNEFKEMEEKNLFALNWHIYGLNYGVSIKIDKWLENGDLVLVNVSRTIVEETRKIYKNIKVVFIEVPFEISLKRLKERGRENEQQLNMRIERARKNKSFPAADYVIDNSKDLEYAIKQFLEYIKTITKD